MPIRLSDIPLITQKPSQRNVLIDNYRGWVIFTVFVWCCVFNHLSTEDAPLFLFHTDKYGVDVAFGIMDYGMSFFILASGMTMKMVFDKRANETNVKNAYMQSVKRSFGVMGIGMVDLICKDIGDNKFTPEGVNRIYGWEVFGSIGMGLLIGTIFINLRKIYRLIAGILIIVCYAFAFGYIPYVGLVGAFPSMTYGGPIMGMACSGMILIFSVAGELIINKNYIQFFSLYIGSIIAAVPSIIFTSMAVEDYKVNPDLGVWGEMFSISFSKARAGFLIVSIPVALSALIVLWGITEIIKKPIILLADMGRNTILFFFTFAVTQLLTQIIGNMIDSLWIDICVSITIALTVCVCLNVLLKWTKFTFTV